MDTPPPIYCKGKTINQNEYVLELLAALQQAEYCAQDGVCPVCLEDAPGVSGIGTGGHEESCVIGRVLGPLVQAYTDCVACDGTGMLKEGPCEDCEGKGKRR